MPKHIFSTMILVLMICTSINAQSQYGGWDGLKSKSTGFFHVEKIDGKWWCIDPSGSAFYAVGTDHVNYNVHWCEALGYAPYAENVRVKFNKDESAWAKSSTDRLREWHFNLLSANNSPSTRNRGLAYTEFISIGAEFSSYEAIVDKIYWTGFPDVFSPNFIKYCRKMAQDRCPAFKEDKWLFGYFLDNELEWFGKAGSITGLAEETIKRPASSYAKKALVQLLKNQYTSISSFNTAWGTNLSSWEDALASTNWSEKSSKKVIADKTVFVRLCADKYFSISTTAIREADPNHMILGCRFAGNAPDIVDMAGKYCDIVTINFYGMVDLDKLTAPGLYETMQGYYKKAKRPLMITEWSFPALDAGLPSTTGAGMRVRTQADKAKAFEVYQTSLFSMPFFVGSDYFMWVDEPALGIAKTFPENSNYGLVDVNDDPWPVFTAKVSQVNKKVYDIHSGKVSDIGIVNVDTSRNIRINLKNSGTLDCQTSLILSIDGKSYSKSISVDAGKKTVVDFDCKLNPGGHYITVSIDQNDYLNEINRGNNYYAGFIYTKGYSPVSKGIAICIKAADTKQSVMSIPLDKLPWKFPVRNIQLSTSNGSSVPLKIFDLDRSGNISAADEMVFEMNTEKDLTATYYVSFDTDQPTPKTKLIKAVPVDSVDFTVGDMQVTRTVDSVIGFDSIKISGTEVGSFNTLIQETASTSYFEYPDSVSDVLLWDGGNIKQVQMTFNRKSEGLAAGPYSYKSVYRMGFGYFPNVFKSSFLSATNTDKYPWTLSRYFHYPVSSIGGSKAGEKVLFASAWTDADMGGCYGVYAPKEAEMNTTFWLDEKNSEHADVSRITDIKLSPGQTYMEKPQTVYMFCSLSKDAVNAYHQFEKEMLDIPKWQIFKL